MKAVVELRGGLGNQLFQLCAALEVLDMGFTPTLDESPLRADSQRNLEIGDLALLFNIGTVASQRLTPPFLRRRQSRLVTDPPGEFGQIRRLVSGRGRPLRLRGYFQHFANVSQHIESLRGALAHTYPTEHDCDSGTIAVHVRRGDYVSDIVTRDYHGNLEPDYYQRAIDTCATESGIDRVVVYSDDVEFISSVLVPRLALKLPSMQFSIRRNPYPSTLQELNSLRHYTHHVIANSTFSWWIAMLSAQSYVVGPRRWWASPDAPSADGLKYGGWSWL